MKSTVTILMLFICLLAVNAQIYKSAFRADMCDCLDLESQKRTLTENAFKACLRETLPKYATQIDAQIVEEDVNKKFYKGQLARKELLVSMQTELIYSCDVYYKHLDFKRNSKKLIARETVKESDLEKYNQMVALTPNAMAYFLRAQVQFNLGKIKETEADINKSLELNPNIDNTMATRHELMLLAWVYEEQERYTEAIALYDKIYFGDLDTQIAQLRALADKKAGGTIANIPKIKKGDIKEEVKVKTQRREQSRPRNARKTSKQSKKTDSNTTRKVKKRKTHRHLGNY